jgi:hypothetical protein
MAKPPVSATIFHICRLSTEYVLIMYMYYFVRYLGTYTVHQVYIRSYHHRSTLVSRSSMLVTPAILVEVHFLTRTIVRPRSK